MRQCSGMSPGLCGTTWLVREDARERIGRIVWEWDPLGDDDPYNPHLPRDEYDWLIRGVEQELAAGADSQRLAAYMTEAVRSRYDLDDTQVEVFAERLAAAGG